MARKVRIFENYKIFPIGNYNRVGFNDYVHYLCHIIDGSYGTCTDRNFVAISSRQVLHFDFEVKY